MMGSPEDEPERYDDETLHQVTLSEGFWLGATTVTQDLWEAVTGENPSRFKGDRAETVVVKALPCNNWGLYQMHGNVWELCLDRYAKKYFEGSVNPSGPFTGRLHVIRGGSWVNGGRKCRSAIRNQSKIPADPNNRVGFRLSRGRTGRQ